MIIIVNGPSGCGKTTAIAWMKKAIRKCVDYPITVPLKRGVASIFSIDGNTMQWFMKNPNEEAARLHGVSWRQAQINLFLHLENIYGPTILSDMAIKKFDKEILKINNHIIVDCGKQIEAQALMNRYGHGTGLGLLQIERPGCDFNDYRGYISLECRHQERIVNKYDEELFEVQVKNVLKKWKLIDE